MIRDVPSGRLVPVARDTEWYIAIVPGGWCQKELQVLILKAWGFGQFRLWKASNMPRFREARKYCQGIQPASDGFTKETLAAGGLSLG